MTRLWLSVLKRRRGRRRINRNSGAAPLRARMTLGGTARNQDTARTRKSSLISGGVQAASGRSFPSSGIEMSRSQ